MFILLVGSTAVPLWLVGSKMQVPWRCAASSGCYHDKLWFHRETTQSPPAADRHNAAGSKREMREKPP